MAKYAANTKVSVSRSKTEVDATLRRYGASAVGIMESQTTCFVVFELNGRRVKMELPIVDDEKEQRRKWRVLVLRLKARLEAIAGGDSTVEEEFMPYVLLPDNRVVAEHLIPKLEEAYSGTMPKILLEY